MSYVQEKKPKTVWSANFFHSLVAYFVGAKLICIVCCIGQGTDKQTHTTQPPTHRQYIFIISIETTHKYYVCIKCREIHSCNKTTKKLETKSQKAHSSRAAGLYLMMMMIMKSMWKQHAHILAQSVPLLYYSFLFVFAVLYYPKWYTQYMCA